MYHIKIIKALRADGNESLASSSSELQTLSSPVLSLYEQIKKSPYSYVSIRIFNTSNYDHAIYEFVKYPSNKVVVKKMVKLQIFTNKSNCLIGLKKDSNDSK